VVRRLVPLALLAVGLAVAPAQAGVAHHNPIGFADPTGDGNGAADIARVTVANDTSGLLLFHVGAQNRTELVANDVVLVRIDSDRSAATGEPDRGGGIDYMLEVSGGALVLHRWNGSAFERAPATTLMGVFDAGYVMAVNRSEIGNPSAIRFYAVTLLGTSAPGQADTAPNTSFSEYELSISHVDAMTPRWTPAVPRAGRTFRLSALQLTLQTGDRLPAARMSCFATLAGKRLRGTGRGGCTFRLPATAKGKRFVIAVTAAPAGGEAETGTQAFRVR
jgi:hypothetical protein